MAINFSLVAQDKTYMADVATNPRERVSVEIGDAKQPDLFYPQLKFLHWDNECNMSVRLAAPDYTKGTMMDKSSVLEWTDGKTTCRFYEHNPYGAEKGGLEFEVTFAAPPKTNVVEFTIQTKGFDFHYQPELTPEESLAGTFRPEHVVGSYAVYHSTRGGWNSNQGKQYGTGKAFHIYRPDAVDAKGTRVWCDLNIDTTTGIMSITVPQKFLDDAVYPVVVDPTFGTTGKGASTDNISNIIYGNEATPSTSGTGTNITVWLGGTPTSGNVKGNVYVSTTPHTNGVTDQVNPGDITDTGQLVTLPFTVAPSFTASSTYMLVAWANAGYLMYHDSASSRICYQNLSYGSWPNPATWTNLGRLISIYANYDEPASGGGPIAGDGPLVNGSLTNGRLVA